MMQQALIDTDILSFFLKGHTKVKNCFNEYLKYYGKINISIISFYEIVSGLKHKDANKYLNIFLDFTSFCNILPFTLEPAMIAADIYAESRKIGQAIDDIDILIAGTALANKLVLITHNKKHFQKVHSLEIIDWAN